MILSYEVTCRCFALSRYDFDAVVTAKKGKKKIYLTDLANLTVGHNDFLTIDARFRLTTKH